MSSFLKDACILVSFTVFNIQIDPTNTGFYIFNKNSEPDSLLKNSFDIYGNGDKIQRKINDIVIMSKDKGKEYSPK